MNSQHLAVTLFVIAQHWRDAVRLLFTPRELAIADRILAGIDRDMDGGRFVSAAILAGQLITHLTATANTTHCNQEVTHVDSH